MAVLRMWINTSLCPTAGRSRFCIQIPTSRRALTSAFMVPSLDDVEFTSRRGEGCGRPLELRPGVCGAHLGADPRLAERHDRKGEADDIHAELEQSFRHAHRHGGS